MAEGGAAAGCRWYNEATPRGSEMPVAELDGLEIAYELVGQGQQWVLTPGGRFTKEVGMEAVVALDQWQGVLAASPRNRERLLSMDRREFVEVMDRWMLAYCPCDDSLVPGLDADDVARLAVPILVFRSGLSDMSHTR